MSDISNFRKIKYYIEGEGRRFNPQGLLVCSIMACLAILVGILCLPDVAGWWIMGVALFLEVVMLGIFFGLNRFFREGKSAKQYRDVHKRLKEQGVLCFGVIVSINKVAEDKYPVSIRFGARPVKEKHLDDLAYCNYTVQYKDPDGVDRETETYTVVAPFLGYDSYSRDNIGKRCTVYFHEGKAVVDAIER